jgi:hypothetical protein
MGVQEIKSGLKLPKDSSRSPGIHVSDLLKSMAVRMGKLDDDSEEEEDSLELRMMLGLAWEEWLAKQLTKQFPSILFHNGELVQDSIIGTPDAYEPMSNVIHEFKLTWKTSLRDVESQWMWISQCKSYCYLSREMTKELDNADCLEAWLHVMYVNGDYNGSGPQYRIYQLPFTRQEVDSLWSQMTKEKQRVMEGKANEQWRI